MNRITTFTLGFGAALVVTCVLNNLLHAQGSLEPPRGGPRPSMKTLEEVEPRTNLFAVGGNAGAMHVITQPGSYYLSRNLNVTTANGIEVRASGVTLDLNGFNIYRVSTDPATGTAILIGAPGLGNITIKNGHITGGVTYDPAAPGDRFNGPGFAYGIYGNANPNPRNVRISHIHVSGCDLDGINPSPDSWEPSNAVEHCSVQLTGGIGIKAGQIYHSSALTCYRNAIMASGNVTSCDGESVSLGSGIVAEGSVSDSRGETGGTSSSAYGIYGQNVANCQGSSAGRVGIRALGSVTNSTGTSTGLGDFAHGIEASAVSNSRGTSERAAGIKSSGSVTDSVGRAVGSGAFALDSRGIQAVTVSNSRGTSEGGTGISATTVTNSNGFASSSSAFAHAISGGNVSYSEGVAAGGDGISAFTGIVSYSRGRSSGTGVGLECDTAIGCTSSGGESIARKYLMP